MAYQNKFSVFAVVRETAYGEPVAPTAGNQFVPVQDGYALTPNNENLDSAELTGSLGMAKPRIGIENPDGTVDLYVKASGTEGVEPSYGVMIESAFGGKAVATTELTAQALSTTSLIKVTDGTKFERGQAVLVKNGAGYEMRPVLSVSGNDVTLGFNLVNSPIGSQLGKSVMYKPGSSFPSFTCWDYRGNGGAIQAMAGSRVGELSMAIAAGDFINSTFALAGNKFFFNPIEITASTSKLDFLDEAVARVVTITPGMFRTPYELAAAIQAGMNALGSANTFTCTYAPATKKFTITSSGAILSLLFATGANVANTIAGKIGFSGDQTAALTYTSATAMSFVAPYNVAFDNVDANVAKSNQVFVGSATDTACFQAESFDFSLSDEIIDRKAICADSGIAEKVATGRKVTVSINGYMDGRSEDLYNRFANGSETSFMFAFGPKSGGNFVPGKSGMLYMPTCTISSFDPSQVTDGICAVQFELTGYVAAGKDEVYLNFV